MRDARFLPRLCVQVVDAMAVDAVGVVAEVREESHMAIDRAACGVF